MKKDRFLIVSLISIILFNMFFLILLLFYNDIIIIPNAFFKNITKEYWYTSQSYTSIQNNIISITFLLKLLFLLVLLGEIFYIIFNEKYQYIIGKRYVVKVVLIGVVIDWGNFFFVKYIAEHYRLFMALTSTFILSMMLLSMILKVQKYLNNNKVDSS